jgi:MFS family permease
MRIITATVPSALAGTAQAVYGLVGVGGATAGLTILSGWLYAHFGPAGFWAMGLLCIAAFPVVWMLHRALSAQVRRPGLNFLANVDLLPQCELPEISGLGPKANLTPSHRPCPLCFP